MYAYRTTWHTTQANQQQAIDDLIAFLNKHSENKRTNPRVATRVYAPELSPNVIVYEEVWESMEDHDAWWEAWNAEPHEDLAAWTALVEHASSTYRWIVTEWR